MIYNLSYKIQPAAVPNGEGFHFQQRTVRHDTVTFHTSKVNKDLLIVCIRLLLVLFQNSEKKTATVMN